MSILFTILYLLLGTLVLLSVRLVTTSIHELGHALPALWFTRDSVQIYVGSYGDQQHSFPIKIGRLQAYFKWRLTEWNLGVCMHRKTPHFGQELLIILGGPLASLLFGTLLVLWIWNNDFSPTSILLITIFIVSSILDFFVNIIPSNKSLPMQDGSQCYNDGYQLQRLLRIRNFPPAYATAMAHQESGEDPAAIEQLESLLAQGIRDREIYRQLARAYQQTRQYDGVLKVMKTMGEEYQLQTEDEVRLAEAHFYKGQYPEAIGYYNRALYLDFENTQLLLGRGRAYLQAGEYERAAKDFQVALAFDPKLGVAYNYLGLALVRLQALDEGKQWLDRALELSPEDSEVHLHLAFYYEQKSQAQQALFHFEKAQTLGSQHHGLEFYIEAMKKELEK